ncbi:mechanosensitive ion channel [Mycolicibacterium sp. 018/SC-01/001]|nr:mechanosensitive ion channel [Mycolicibacterium sp. 018/SC-01/001]
MTSQPWFWPTLAVVVALPVALLILTEVYQWLSRRGSSYARPVLLLRNAVLPALALYILTDQLNDSDVEATWPRIAATVFGFLVILFALSGANAALFGEARPGSWRERLPTIFIDLGRLVVIVIGLGLLFSWVWGTDVGGLFAAVGVTSIVIGLAVQSAVGPVIAGLFLLFEQPFRIGDWLDTSEARGRVLEVNWRSVHIDTGNGIKIVPNASLATGSFTNLSRVTGAAFQATATLAFSPADRPATVVEMLRAVAEALPFKAADLPARVSVLGAGEYRVSVPVIGPAEESAAKNILLHRVWYAARRAGVRLDDVEPQDDVAPHMSAQAMRIGTRLGLDDQTAAAMVEAGRLLSYAEGEIVQAAGSIPEAIAFVLDGELQLTATARDGASVPIGLVEAGDFIGATALTRQRVLTGAVAVVETTVLSIPRHIVAPVVQQHPGLARQLGRTIDLRRRAAEDALDPEKSHI